MISYTHIVSYKMDIRKTAAKSIESLHPISEETKAIILKKTGKYYQYAHQLPKSLNLSYCRDLVDVSALGGVRMLFLDECIGITDVSALGNVKKLYLRWCTGITDVSALGRIKILILAKCTGITDVSMLGDVKHLYLYGCTGITDFSMVPHAIRDYRFI